MALNLFLQSILYDDIENVQLKTHKLLPEVISMNKFVIREAGVADSEAIASLHASSWRIAYRGLLADDYLDNDLAGERRKYWLAKMPCITSREFVLVAESDTGIIGFIAVLDIPELGYAALVDNLHVTPDLKGKGIGGAMMRAAAARLDNSGRTSFYLWVLKGNTSAEKFYQSLSGKPADEKSSEFGGKIVAATRFVWKDLSGLLKSDSLP